MIGPKSQYTVVIKCSGSPVVGIPCVKLTRMKIMKRKELPMNDVNPSILIVKKALEMLAATCLTRRLRTLSEEVPDGRCIAEMGSLQQRHDTLPTQEVHRDMICNTRPMQYAKRFTMICYANE